MTYRFATRHDCLLLAEWNHQLIRDEGHRNRMTVLELETRMRDWLAGEYRAVIFEEAGTGVAYAVYREQPNEVFLRQFFVARDCRRRGLGRRAIELLRFEIWPPGKRLIVEVLVSNAVGQAFWRSVGYKDYALTLEILPEKNPLPTGTGLSDQRGALK
jgi:GNAT superfamily N-acetyltransferase